MEIRREERRERRQEKWRGEKLTEISTGFITGAILENT